MQCTATTAAAAAAAAQPRQQQRQLLHGLVAARATLNSIAEPPAPAAVPAAAAV
jgi:hypothetical protein